MYFIYSALSSQITFLIGTCSSLGACAWFFIQPVESRNAVYAATVLIGSGSSVMLVTSLSLIADLIGDDKVQYLLSCLPVCTRETTRGRSLFWDKWKSLGSKNDKTFES